LATSLDRLIDLYPTLDKPDETKKWQAEQAKSPKHRFGGEEMKPAELLPKVYDELRKLASAKLESERPAETLDVTALVHEAFLKCGGEHTVRDTKRRLASRRPGDAAHPGRSRPSPKCRQTRSRRRVDLESDHQREIDAVCRCTLNGNAAIP
jgi:hypothetical protein